LPANLYRQALIDECNVCGIDLQGTSNYTMNYTIHDYKGTKGMEQARQEMVKMRNLFSLKLLILMNILKDSNNYASITLQ
jgi:hypothetical protein